MISDVQINDLIEKIISEYQPEKILLFGSFADGTQNNDSDVDLLVIKDSEASRCARISELKMCLAKYKFLFPYDLLVYTKNELINENFGKFSFIDKILKSGKVMYER